MNSLRFLVCFAVTCLLAGLTAATEPALVQSSLDESVPISFRDQDGSMLVLRGEMPIATYVYRHPKVLRPFFAHVKTPSGIQATRNFPPTESDRSDHPDMHPGVWLAFGDISGEDFWRNKGRVVHERFAQKPTGGKGVGQFIESKVYRRADGDVICRETFVCSIRVLPEGYLLLFDSTFLAPTGREFYFGDQEEMGLGIRVATPVTELKNGKITDADSRTGAKQVWSHASKWCDYSGTAGDEALGITILCHPDNFRPSWMHARNYGLIAANPFGQKAMNKGEPSKIVVTPDKPLRLRYGIFIHNETPDLNAIFQTYVAIGRKE